MPLWRRAIVGGMVNPDSFIGEPILAWFVLPGYPVILCCTGFLLRLVPFSDSRVERGASRSSVCLRDSGDAVQAICRGTAKPDQSLGTAKPKEADLHTEITSRRRGQSDPVPWSPFALPHSH